MADKWVAKVRYTHPAVLGYVEHVIRFGREEDCRTAANWHNANYQTDEAIAEPWDDAKFKWPTPYTDP